MCVCASACLPLPAKSVQLIKVAGSCALHASTQKQHSSHTHTHRICRDSQLGRTVTGSRSHSHGPQKHSTTGNIITAIKSHTHMPTRTHNTKTHTHTHRYKYVQLRLRKQHTVSPRSVCNNTGNGKVQ